MLDWLILLTLLRVVALDRRRTSSPVVQHSLQQQQPQQAQSEQPPEQQQPAAAAVLGVILGGQNRVAPAPAPAPLALPLPEEKSSALADRSGTVDPLSASMSPPPAPLDPGVVVQQQAHAERLYSHVLVSHTRFPGSAHGVRCAVGAQAGNRACCHLYARC